MEIEISNILKDSRSRFKFDFNHPDVQAAMKIEPYYDLFEIFNIQDTEMITLILAGSITITKNLGVFSKEEIYTELNYMSQENRKKVVDYLIKRQWITFNGVDFEVPDRVKSLIKFLFTSFVRGEISVSDNISLILAEYEMTEHYNLSDTDKDIAYHIALIGELHNFKDRMERVLQRRNQKEIMQVIKQSNQIINNIQMLKKLAKKKENNIFARFSMRNEAHISISGIIDAISRIMQAGVMDIIGNTKSAMADYISPEMVTDFLENASVDLMAGIIKDKFSSPKIISHVSEEKVIVRTKAFIEARPDQIEATPSPPQVEYVEEETIVQAVIDPIKIFYEELIVNMGDKDIAPFEEVVFNTDDSFGIAMYRTGQMLRISSEIIANINENQLLTAKISDSIKDIAGGSVDKMTEAFVERR